MKKEFFENEIGEAYVKATLDNGLKIFILEKPQYKSAYALFGTKYGSIDTIFNDICLYHISYICMVIGCS